MFLIAEVYLCDNFRHIEKLSGKQCFYILLHFPTKNNTHILFFQLLTHTYKCTFVTVEPILIHCLQFRVYSLHSLWVLTYKDMYPTLQYPMEKLVTALKILCSTYSSLPPFPGNHGNYCVFVFCLHSLSFPECHILKSYSM